MTLHAEITVDIDVCNSAARRIDIHCPPHTAGVTIIASNYASHIIDQQTASTSWQRALARGPRQVGDLLALLELPASCVAKTQLKNHFPLRVPLGFVARMEKGNPNDPLLRQILPIAAEAKPSPGFTADPVADLAALRPPGLVHKYHGRALLMTTGACAIHCRYCFRRHFPYNEHAARGDSGQMAIKIIAADPSLSEIILSGGDPLMLPDKRLFALAEEIIGIPHIRRLRWHTRLPIVLPERLDEAFLEHLSSLNKNNIMVIHCNHPHEIDASVRAALTGLRQTGVTLLNQSVLLKGINDSTEILAELSERLFDCGVMPYYLHQLDRVQGAAHFEVSTMTAVAIQQELRARLPGYLVPRLVREIAGEPAKTPLAE